MIPFSNSVLKAFWKMHRIPSVRLFLLILLGVIKSWKRKKLLRLAVEYTDYLETSPGLLIVTYYSFSLLCGVLLLCVHFPDTFEQFGNLSLFGHSTWWPKHKVALTYGSNIKLYNYLSAADILHIKLLWFHFQFSMLRRNQPGGHKVGHSLEPEMFFRLVVVGML